MKQIAIKKPSLLSHLNLLTEQSSAITFTEKRSHLSAHKITLDHNKWSLFKMYQYFLFYYSKLRITYVENLLNI